VDSQRRGTGLRRHSLDAGCVLQRGSVEGSSETRAETARQPVGFFQVKRQPLEPSVARDAEPVRRVILAGVRYMIDHAASRESVMLRILLESGARVSEVATLNAGGLRQARNPQIGIDVKALVRNKGDQCRSKPIWFSDDTRERLLRYIARVRSKHDPQWRTHLERLGDDEPIFLSNRGKQLGYSASSRASGAWSVRRSGTSTPLPPAHPFPGYRCPILLRTRFATCAPPSV
jgi:site-specific recombinase XerC